MGARHDWVALSRLHPAAVLCCVQYIFTHCHVYDSERNYVPFDSAKPETLFEIQRRALPDSM